MLEEDERVRKRNGGRGQEDEETIKEKNEEMEEVFLRHITP